MQDPGVTRDAEIGYGIAAGTVWCIYVFITMVWEGRRSMRLRKERYDDSQARKERTQSSSNSSLEEETSNVS